MRGVVTAYRRLLGNGPLTRLLAGEFISSIGDWLYLVALLIIIYQRTDDPVVLGVVGAARLLPYVFLSIPAGYLADRLDRRLILMTTDLGRAGLMVVLAWLVTTDAPVEAIVLVTILAASLSSFFGPAIGAYLPSLVKDEADLGPANTAYASLDNIAFVIGPALAALLLGIADLGVAFLLNALSFLFIAVILWRLPPSVPGRSAEGAQGAAPVEPFDWSAARRPVAGLVVLDSVAGFVLGGLGVMTVLIAFDQLGGGEAETGLLSSAVGVGGLIGALVAGVLILRRRLGPPLLAGAVLMGAAVGILGVSASLPISIVAMAVSSLGCLLVGVVMETLFQRIIPDEVRGRTLGFMGTVSLLLYTAGSVALPLSTELVGLVPTLLASGIAIVLAGGFTVLAIGPWATQAPRADAMIARLGALAMFDGLPPGRIETAERLAVKVPMEPGQVIIAQGEAADRFYVIGEGEVEVTQVSPGDREPRALRRMGAGEGFGEIGLLARSLRTATVTAVTAGTLVALDGEAFLDLVSGAGIMSPFVDVQHGQVAGAA